MFFPKIQWYFSHFILATILSIRIFKFLQSRWSIINVYSISIVNGYFLIYANIILNIFLLIYVKTKIYM